MLPYYSSKEIAMFNIFGHETPNADELDKEYERLEAELEGEGTKINDVIKQWFSLNNDDDDDDDE